MGRLCVARVGVLHTSAQHQEPTTGAREEMYGHLLTYAGRAMPMPTIAGVVRATFRGTNATGSGWANVVHARYAGGASSPGSTEIAALHAKLVRLWTGLAYGAGAAYMTKCKSTLNLADATYYVLNGTALPILVNINLNGTGGTGAQCPQEVAAVMTLRTGFRGRRYRGRLYFPAPLVSQLDTNGNFVSAFITDITTQWTLLQTDLGTIQWSMGVASYGKSLINDPNDPHDKIATTWTPFFTDAVSVAIDSKPDVQRRRK